MTSDLPEILLATDTYYYDQSAKCVVVEFGLHAEAPSHVFFQELDRVEPYQPGSFYKRELPCILACMEQVDTTRATALLVDGHVYTSNSKEPGLGAHVYTALQEKLPVIGVAKSSFAHNGETVHQVFRGKSRNPLYISAIGLSLNQAAQCVREMHGAYRFPTVLKTLDDLTKDRLKV